jgi:4-carboxymuconolactone decarboxylase
LHTRDPASILSDRMTARIAPLPRDQWTEDAAAALRAAFGDRATERLLADGPDAPRVPNVLTTMMRHPALAGPFLVYNAVLLNTPTLEPRLRELMILRVAWRTRSHYEWVQHVRIAQSCGVTAQELEAIGSGSDAAEWTPLETDLLAATDQLLDRYVIDDGTWARLADQLDERQLIEVAFVVGTYTCLAMAFNSVGLELDPELHDVVAPPFPAGGE